MKFFDKVQGRSKEVKGRLSEIERERQREEKKIEREREREE